MDIQNVLLVISSVLVMIVTAVSAKPSMTPTQKRWIAIAASVIIGTITALVNGQIAGVPQDFIDGFIKVLTSIAFVAAGSQAAYLLFKGPAERLEAKVNGDAPGVAPYVEPQGKGGSHVPGI